MATYTPAREDIRTYKGDTYDYLFRFQENGSDFDLSQLKRVESIFLKNKKEIFKHTTDDSLTISGSSSHEIAGKADSDTMDLGLGKLYSHIIRFIFANDDVQTYVVFDVAIIGQGGNDSETAHEWLIDLDTSNQTASSEQLTGLAASAANSEAKAKQYANNLNREEATASDDGAIEYYDHAKGWVNTKNPDTLESIQLRKRMRVRDHHDPKPLMTFVNDDGTLAAYEDLYPTLETKGVHGCEAVVTSYVSESESNRSSVGGSEMMTWDEIRELEDAGHEILSHTVNHDNLTDISISDAEDELQNSIEKLVDEGLSTESLVYPFNASDKDVRRVVRKYYRAAGGRIDQDPNEMPIHTYELDRVDLHSASLEEAKESIDEAVENDSWIVWVLHIYNYTGSDLDDELQKIKDIIDYADTNGVDTVTLQEGLDVFENLFDQGDRYSEEGYFAVDPRGKVDNQIDIDIKESDAPVTDYLDRCTTYMEISVTENNNLSSPWPIGAGTVVTHRANVDFNTDYQILFERDDLPVLFRQRSATENQWTDFRELVLGLGIERISLDFGTISAHSTKQVTASFPGIKDSDVVTGHVRNTLIKPGLMFDYHNYHQNESVLVRCANVTDSDINFEETTFVIAVRSYTEASI